MSGIYHDYMLVSCIDPSIELSKRIYYTMSGVSVLLVGIFCSICT